MNNFLLDLAKAHMEREGWAPGTRSYRQNNPGNLRDANGNFIVFPSYGAGLLALENDLRAKIMNRSHAMNEYYMTHSLTYEQATFQTYVSVYAPSSDGNTPVDYCLFLCHKLAHFNVHPTTPLTVLAQLIHGTIDRVPDPSPPHVPPAIPPAVEIANVARRLTNETNPTIKFSLERLLTRLRAFFHGQ